MIDTETFDFLSLLELFAKTIYDSGSIYEWYSQILCLCVDKVKPLVTAFNCCLNQFACVCYFLFALIVVAE